MLTLAMIAICSYGCCCCRASAAGAQCRTGKSAATSSLPLMISPPSSVRLTLSWLRLTASTFAGQCSVTPGASRSQTTAGRHRGVQPLAQRRQPPYPGRQIHKPGMTAVADVYSLDGRRAFSEALPDTDTRQLLAGARSRDDRPVVKPGWRRMRILRFNGWTGSAPPVKREMASASVAPVIPPPTISTLMTGAPPPSAPRSHPPSSPRRR